MIGAALMTLVMGSLVEAAPQPASPVTLELSAPWTEQRPAVLIARSADDPPTELRLSVMVPGSAQLDLGAARAWTITMVSQDLWMAPQTYVTGTGQSSLSLPVHPAGVLIFRPRLGDKATAALSFKARFQSPDATLAGSVECDSREDAVHCHLPALILDVRLSAAGLVPQYRWSALIAAAKPLNLGALAFTRGASFSGFTRVAERIDAEPAIADAIIEVKSDIAASTQGVEEHRRSLTSRDVKPGRNGFFQVPALPPGGYVVQARSGKLRSEVRRITIHESVEAQLNEPLVLEPPFVVNARVIPPLDPWRERWVVELMRVEHALNTGQSVARERADITGSWSARDLTSGDYLLSVGRDSIGKWLNREIHLDGPADLTLDLNLLHVSGKVILGKTPLPGYVWFGGSSGGVAVPVRAKDDGTFRTMLPRPANDVWSVVEIIADEPKVRTSLSNVEIKPVGDGDRANVVLQAGAGAIHGQVVDARSEPVRESSVITFVRRDPESSLVQITTEDDGSFRIHGVAPGVVSLRAATGRAESESIDVRIDEDRTEPVYVELTVLPNRHLRGIVRSAAGPVPGARVLAMPVDSTGHPLFPYATDHEGRFDIPLPASSSTATLSVAAPGYALRILRVDVASGSDRDVFVEQPGGGLTLEAAATSKDSSLFPWLVRSGLAIPMPLLGWFAGQRPVTDGGIQRVTIPLMEAGSVELCWATPVEASGVASRRLPNARCASGYVAPFAHVTLRAPATQP